MNSQKSLYDKVPSWIATIRNGFVPFFSLAYTDEADAFRQTADLRPLVFDKGRILIDRFTVTQPQFSSSSVAWAHQSDRGFTGGSLFYARSGTELHGHISIGDDSETATESHVFATAFPLSEYTTTLTAAGAGAGAGATDGPILRIGVQTGQGLAPRISVFLDALDVTHGITQSLEARSGRPVLDILLPETPDAAGLSGAAHIVFDIGRDGAVTFTGTITDLGADGDVTVTTWTGERREPAAVESALMEAETPPLAFVDAVLPSGESALSEAELESPEVQRAILAILGKRPDDNDVSNASTSYMMENMKYAMWQDTSDDEVTSRRKWMENYFKEQKPDIKDPQRIETILKDGDWYRSTMATAILGNSLADQKLDSKVVPRPIDDTRRGTLKTYVQTALGADETYTRQQSALWRTVYFDRAPSLKAYAEEDKAKLAARPAGAPTPDDWDGMTWAERILEYATAPKQFQIITDNLSSGTGTVGGDVSQEEKAIADANAKIATFEAKLAQYRTKLAQLQSQSPPDTDMIDMTQTMIDSLESSIALQKASVASLEQQKADREKKALLTMRNVSSLLYALDASGNLSQTYMDGVGMAYLAKSLENTDIGRITDYESTLTDYIERFLNDVANNRVTVFGPIDETGDLNELLKAEGLTAKQLASMMVQSLVNARSPNFLESANSATQTFSQRYPKLTGVFRIGLIAGYIFTFMKVLNVVQQGTGSDSTVDKVMTYGTFTSLAIETVRSLATNVKNLFTSIFRRAGDGGAQAAPIPQEPGAFGRFFRSIGQAIARGVMRVVTTVRAVAGGIAEAVAANRLFAAVRGFFSRLVGAVGRAVGWVRDRVVGGITGLAGRIAASPRWAAFASFMGKAFTVIAKGLMVIASIWTAVSEGINMVNVWKTSQSGWQKALATLQFVAIALSTVATVIGVFSSAVVWSGAGAILALVALGIGLLISYLWPPESTIQKMISQVFVPFIDGTAAPAVAKTKEVTAPTTMDDAEEDMVAGGELAMA
ncbi:hypothetical protein [Azospirillum halopraeferens]|uniref:hypothetical protein n=1 Tax=Azospirillum halopraeferens TaxID=34010 RepID=UPI0003FF55B8|nr:hypothetical protein [Azospirillum halopraeferens]